MMAISFRKAASKRRVERRRFGKDTRGSVAVEFALTAIPFFVLLFAILEAGVVFFATATLEQAVNDAARLVRTGQAQTASTTTQQLTQTICNNVVLLSDCTSKLKLDVRVYTNFTAVSFPSVRDSDGKIKDTKLAFNMGKAGDIVVIRAFYIWSIWSPFVTGLANNGEGSRMLQTSVAFRNEPYTS